MARKKTQKTTSTPQIPVVDISKKSGLAIVQQWSVNEGYLPELLRSLQVGIPNQTTRHDCLGVSVLANLCSYYSASNDPEKRNFDEAKITYGTICSLRLLSESDLIARMNFSRQQVEALFSEQSSPSPSLPPQKQYNFQKAFDYFSRDPNCTSTIFLQYLNSRNIFQRQNPQYGSRIDLHSSFRDFGSHLETMSSNVSRNTDAHFTGNTEKVLPPSFFFSRDYQILLQVARRV